MSNGYRIILSIVLLGLCPILGFAQEPETKLGPVNVFADPYAYLDTVYVEKYSLMDIFYNERLDDSTFQASDLWYDHTNTGNFLYANLGHLGSAHLKDYYQPDLSIGFRNSFPQYNLYKLPKNSPEYRINAAFTDLKFSQGPDQSQQSISADFAGRYRNGQLIINYDRIKDKGTFLSQLNIHTGVSAEVNLSLKPVFLQFQFLSNIIQAQDNGGFIFDDQFPPPFSTFVSDAPVNLHGNAETRHHEKHYIVRDYWPISGRLDQSSFLAIRHEFSYNNQYARFFDTNPNVNYYPQSFYDDRGLRYFIKNNSIENNFHLLWRTNQLSWLQGQLNAGLIHKWHFLEQYFSDFQQQWMAIDGRLQTDIGNFMRLDSRITQSFIPDVADTRFLNTVDFGFRKYFNIQGNFNFLRHRADINEETFFINAGTLWDDKLTPESVLQLGGSIEAVPYKTKIGIEYSHVANLIYYDKDWLRKQANSGVDLLRLYLSTRFSYKFINLDSESSLQLTQNDLLPYAGLVSDLRLYGKFYLFKKKMLLTTGPYGKFYSQPHSYTYVPVLGQFTLSDSRVRNSGYQLNYMIAFRVQSLSVFAHIEGLQSFWDPRAYYEIQDYAHSVVSFRFGLSWKLYN